MAKRGGFPGMGGNMNNLMKQAQKMQKQMEETTKQLEETEYEATAGGGVVKVVVSGKKEVVSVSLDEEVVDRRSRRRHGRRISFLRMDNGYGLLQQSDHEVD